MNAAFALIDSHCHLDDDRFDQDRAAVIERANRLGITQLVIPATTAARWSKVRAVTQSANGIYAAYGLHPMFMSQHQPPHLQALDQWLDQNPAVAVGECGLDFYHSDSDRQQQLDLMRGQLALARDHDLPVILHARKALDEVIRELRRVKLQRGGVVHSFSGSMQQAEVLADLGFKLGIAATVSFERARKLREVVRGIDLNALLIETDAPDQPGAAHRGQRNEPAYILDHLAVMSDLRGTSPQDLAGQLNRNCRQLFRLNDPQ